VIVTANIQEANSTGVVNTTVMSLDLDLEKTNPTVLQDF